MITDLRYIERDGRKVLQAFSSQPGVTDAWIDVPTVTKGPAVLITSAEFWAAWESVSSERYLPHCTNAQMKAMAEKLGLGGK
jgi:hypothetical protein